MHRIVPGPSPPPPMSWPTHAAGRNFIIFMFPNPHKAPLHEHQTSFPSSNKMRQTHVHRYLVKRRRAVPAPKDMETLDKEVQALVTGLNKHKTEMENFQDKYDVDDQWLEGTFQRMTEFKKREVENIEKQEEIQKRSKQLDELTSLEPAHWEQLVHDDNSSTIGDIVEKTCIWLESLTHTKHRELVAHYTRSILGVGPRHGGDVQSYDSLDFVAETQYETDAQRAQDLEKQLLAAKQELTLSVEREQGLQKRLEQKSSEVKRLKNLQLKYHKQETQHLQTLQELKKTINNNTTEIAGLQKQVTNLENQLHTKGEEILDMKYYSAHLEDQVERANVQLAEACTQQRLKAEQETHAVLRLLLSDMTLCEDDAAILDPIIPSLNAFSFYDAEGKDVEYWNLFSTSGECDSNVEHRPLGAVDFLREMLNIFAVLAQPGEHDDVAIIDILRPLVCEVATRDSIPGEVVQLVCQKANDRLRFIDPDTEEDPDVQMSGIQICQFLLLTAQRWPSLNIAYDETIKFRICDNVFGRLCRSLTEVDMHDICQSYPSPSPWLYCGNHGLMTELECKSVAVIDFGNRAIRWLYKSDCGTAVTKSVDLPMSNGTSVTIELPGEVEGLLWWWTNIVA